jgi:hypothetical protein
MINALGYYAAILITAVKSVIVDVPGYQALKSLMDFSLGPVPYNFYCHN